MVIQVAPLESTSTSAALLRALSVMDWPSTYEPSPPESSMTPVVGCCNGRSRLRYRCRAMLQYRYRSNARHEGEHYHHTAQRPLEL